MPDRPASPARTVVGVALVVAFAAGCVALVGFGLLRWLLTVLEAAYPCGEGSHPACVLAHPERIDLAYALLLAGPAMCVALSVAGAVVRITERRRLVLPAAVTFAVALACTLIGSRMLDATLAERVPWS